MDTRSITSTRRAAVLAAFATVAVSMLACTSTGVGSGSLSPGNTPVRFNWISKDGGNTGTMSAALDNGVAFSGPFLQVTSSVRVDALAPMWHGWRHGWADWGPGGPYPASTFATDYSGKVVANLQGPGDQHLRCRFRLNDPVAGMGGGGQGECQFGGGRTVQAVFART